TQTTYPQLLNLNRKYPINLNRWCLLNFIGVFSLPPQILLLHFPQAFCQSFVPLQNLRVYFEQKQDYP
ncbi:MAG: hypothetical protein MUF58_19425, partial [Arcicella sp.]|nr:hypothetical protein [Arcicella sp.]